jgi:hypothetical protein
LNSFSDNNKKDRIASSIKHCGKKFYGVRYKVAATERKRRSASYYCTGKRKLREKFEKVHKKVFIFLKKTKEN